MLARVNCNFAYTTILVGASCQSRRNRPNDIWVIPLVPQASPADIPIASSGPDIRPWCFIKLNRTEDQQGKQRKRAITYAKIRDFWKENRLNTKRTRTIKGMLFLLSVMLYDGLCTFPFVQLEKIQKRYHLVRIGYYIYIYIAEGDSAGAFTTFMWARASGESLI